MKAFVFLFAILFNSGINYGQKFSSPIRDSIANDLLNQILFLPDIYINEGNIIPKKIALIDIPIIWQPYSFSIPDSIIPKDKKKAAEFYDGEYGIYAHYFVFKSKTLDSILSASDKEFIIEQTKFPILKQWNVKKNTAIAIVKDLKDKKYKIRYAYSMPVFSANFNIAIIKKITYSRPTAKDCLKDCDIDYSSEINFFFQKDKQNIWRLIGGGSSWEN